MLSIAQVASTDSMNLNNKRRMIWKKTVLVYCKELPQSEGVKKIGKIEAGYKTFRLRNQRPPEYEAEML